VIGTGVGGGLCPGCDNKAGKLIVLTYQQPVSLHHYIYTRKNSFHYLIYEQTPLIINYNAAETS